MSAKTIVRHPRLAMFRDSLFMNVVSLLGGASLLVLNYSDFNMVAAICIAVILVTAICYTLWFWVKKPDNVPVSQWLSSFNRVYVVYFLVVVSGRLESLWWTEFGIVAAMLALLVLAFRGQDS